MNALPSPPGPRKRRAWADCTVGPLFTRKSKNEIFRNPPKARKNGKDGEKMSRYDELMAAVCQDDADRTTYGPLVEKAVLLEQKMEQLEALPHIKVDPKDPSRQKTLPAFKQYKELLQQYGNIIRILGRVTVEDDNTAESPLRTWARERTGRNADS